MARLNVLGLDAATYARHSLHADDRVWVEKNCYVDIWIELIHAVGCEPLAMLPFTLAIDFEGDQWTFFKPPHDELRDLYGIDCQELNCWRPLLEHAQEHLAAGKVISTEADAWWLPDVAGTDYRRQHTKSTIVVADLDVDARRLGYFHNAGYFTLDGEDFDKTFRLDLEMPFFAELVRLDRKVVRKPDELRELSRGLLRRHLARCPSENPIAKFAARFARDLPELQAKGLANYHAWAFATVRQLGAACELMARYLEWLGEDPAIAHYDAISTGAKSFILKAARAVSSKKPFDASAMFAEWTAAWDNAIGSLR
ncbi:MAG TPA: DUF1839 family protein [Kofleriaceae bacterium]|nr:DUF1839 family protein [Kofleriaceae bacterium]